MPSHSGTLWLSSSCARYATPERPTLPPRKKEWVKLTDSANGHQLLSVLFGE